MNKKELSIEELQTITGGFSKEVNSKALFVSVLTYGIGIAIVKKILGL